MKRFLLFAVVILVIGSAVTAFVLNGKQDEETVPEHVVVERGEIVDEALAVGTIEPRVEVEVKSQVSGVVKRQFADVGDFVRAGDPLIEIQPNPTPRELIDAERQIEMREIELTNLKAEFDRQNSLFQKQLMPASDFERTKRNYEQSALQVDMAKEQLTMLREGKVTTKSGSVESVVRSPVSGFILDKGIEIGDPVVPLTTYQAGTPLMTMADMNDLVFRGTVDEIDVGRLKEGQRSEIRIGALPNANVAGTLSRIWLKARKDDNSTVFPVEIEILSATESKSGVPEGEAEDVVLRAGFSANVDIIVERRENVILVPERVVQFDTDSTWVRILTAENTFENRVITTGLSDAIHVEVISGLEPGDRVAEKPEREIE
jgi:HlyD family secretion protein